MSFAALQSSHQRMRILRMLAEDPDYSHNEYLIQEGLGLYGHKISGDKLRTELAWLQEQGLVTIDESTGVQVVKLTSRGNDIACGRAIVPGVQRPGPEDC